MHFIQFESVIFISEYTVKNAFLLLWPYQHQKLYNISWEVTSLQTNALRV